MSKTIKIKRIKYIISNIIINKCFSRGISVQGLLMQLQNIKNMAKTYVNR